MRILCAALWFVVQLHVACVAVAVFLQMHDGPRLNFSFSAYMYISLGNGTVYTCGNEIPQKQVYRCRVTPRMQVGNSRTWILVSYGLIWP